VLYRYEHHVLPTFERYIKPYMEEADLVINNNSLFAGGLEVMRGHIKSFLQETEQRRGEWVQDEEE